MSKHGIEITMRLPVKIVQKKKWYVASCPSLDVVSQGETAEEARENLKEALFLFLDSCIELSISRNVNKINNLPQSPHAASFVVAAATGTVCGMLSSGFTRLARELSKPSEI